MQVALITFVIVVSFVLNWGGLAVMAGTTIWTVIKVVVLRRKDQGRLRDALLHTTGTPHFWLAYWVSLVALVVENLAPLGYFGAIPAGAVWTIFIGNLGLSFPPIVIAFRVAVWRAHVAALRP